MTVGGDRPKAYVGGHAGLLSMSRTCRNDLGCEPVRLASWGIQRVQGFQLRGLWLRISDLRVEGLGLRL